MKNENKGRTVDPATGAEYLGKTLLKIPVESLKRRHADKPTIAINIKIRPSMSKWLKENDYSPTAIFNEACQELGYAKAK